MILELLLVNLLSVGPIPSQTSAAPPLAEQPNVSATSGIPANFVGVCQTYMTRYMRDLTTNFISNPGTQCVAVAGSLILGFYDTYLNDDIINDCFDQPAVASCQYTPDGVPSVFLPGSTGSPGPGALFNPDNSNVWSNVLTGISGESTYIPSGITALLNLHQLGTMFSLLPVNAGDILTTIENGLPVLANIGIQNSGGEHAIVVFDHDIYGNVLYHNGYSTQNPFGYDVFGCCPLASLHSGSTYAIMPSATIPHVCSDNYVTGSGDPMCPCMLGSITYPGHVHQDTYYDGVTHVSTCPTTGESAKKYHSRVIDPATVTHAGHSEVCSCGDSVFHAHSPSSYSYVDYDDHLIHFDDGCSLQEEHYVVDIMPYGTDVHRIECVCGADGIGQHFEYFSIPYNGNYYMVCGCGFTNCPGGLTQEQQEAVRAQYLLELNGGNE